MFHLSKDKSRYRLQTQIPNSWITQNAMPAQAVINKQKTFESRDAAANREAKAVLRAEIRLAKSAFRDKVEKQHENMTLSEISC